MDCNKEEAIRAKQLAEKKMENNDFEGAQKIALKAQNLFPELENITQLLSICDVHCSAQKKMLGADKDWYGILQAEKLADEMTIKKQYRRLALYLHPDKNRFPGAEAAFKLICEANAVLSDSVKKSSYDSRIRFTVKSAPVNLPPHHMNRNAPFNYQFGAKNSVFNGFSNLNQQQATNSSASVRPDVFWTSCPFCSSTYQYHRKFANTTLRCPKCSKNFTGYEISVQGVPMGSKWVPPSAQHVPPKPSASQTAGFVEKVVLGRGKVTPVQNHMGSSASQAGQRSAGRKPVRPIPGAAKVVGDLNAKETDGRNVNTSHGRKEGGTYDGNAINRETGDLKNKTKKRGRKLVVESSSESSDTSTESDLEDVTTEENLGSGPYGAAYFPRRSSRKKQQVSYNEGDGDDLASPDNANRQNDGSKGDNSKHGNLNSFPTEAGYSKSETKATGTVHLDESLRDKDANVDKEVKVKGEAGGKSDTVEIISDLEGDSYAFDSSDIVEDISCDDPEFNNFEKDRDASCFAGDQFWACYDDADGMPRFYAKVIKAHASPFELSVKWLEAGPTDEAQVKWVNEGLPVGCGSFKLGKTQKTTLRLSFSHQVHFGKGNKRGSLVIYPREGQVWALLKEYEDMAKRVESDSDPESGRSSELENDKDFKYEIVEVLADFDSVAGVKVCYLDKVKGFVSLFQRSGSNSFLIGPNDLYKFSHQVPYFKMTGSEKEGVPVGSLELDPASLPLNPDHLYYHGKAKMDPGLNCAPPTSAKKQGGFVKSESTSTQREFVDLEGSDVERSEPHSSPRGLNFKGQSAK